MMTNARISKKSFAIATILISSLSVGAAFGADERDLRDAANHGVSAPALDVASNAAVRSPVVPGASSAVVRIRVGPDGRPETTKPSAGAPQSKPSTASKEGGQISRAEVIRRAKYWFDNRNSIAYDWNAAHRDPDSASHQYRQDCSGFVSMTLHLTTSLSTVTLPGVGTKISRSAMQPGDFTGILGNGTAGDAGHVRLFEKWANKGAGTYWAYDFGSTPVKHQIYTLKSDAPRNNIGWTAYRYKKVR